MKKIRMVEKLPLFLSAAVVVSVMPVILFCTSIKDKIPPENRVFMLILLETVFVMLFANLIYSRKGQQRVDEKMEKARCKIYVKMGKYVVIFFTTAVLSYVLLRYSDRVATFAVLAPVLLFWMYRTFKKK